MGVLVFVIAAGDQRRIEVILTTPAQGEPVAVSARAVTFTFNREPDLDALSDRLVIEPSVAGFLRVRGRTAEYVFEESLPPGGVAVRLDQGSVGRAGERLSEPFALSFTVREPGIAYVEDRGESQALIVTRPERPVTVLAEAPRIRAFAVASDGSRVAAVLGNVEDESSSLVLIDTAAGTAQTIVDDPDLSLGEVVWAADGNALLIARRDRLVSGGLGVPRLWLLRTDGEFVGLLEQEGAPSMSPAWAPDGQAVAYVTPTTGEAIVLNLTTRERQAVGSARGRNLAWSPNGLMLAYEATPPEDTPNPPQPVRVAALDGAFTLTLGNSGEVRSQPRFLDDGVLMSLWREVGTDPRGTELRFESVETGELLRAILLAPGTDFVTVWGLDPSRERIVYAVRSGALTTVLTLDLESSDREVIGTGDRPAWMP